MTVLTSAAFEVSLGLVFTFLIFSTVCSGINEGIQRVLNARGQALFSAINDLIGDAYAEKFWQHKLITGLMTTRSAKVKRTQAGPILDKAAAADVGAKVSSTVRSGKPFSRADRRLLPSYIAPSTFSAVLIDIANHDPARQTAVPKPPPETHPAAIAASTAVVDAPSATGPDAGVGSGAGSPAEGTGDTAGGTDEAVPTGDAPDKQPPEDVTYSDLAAALRALGLPNIAADVRLTFEEAEANVEKWFNDAMDRLSGWYKRYVVYFLLGLGIVVTVLFNVNSLHVASELWSQPQLQAAVTAEAQAATSPTSTASSAGTNSSTASSTTSPSMKTALAAAETLPIGWEAVNRPSSVGWWSTAIGWLITVAAISLGAPFWFDLLTRMNSLSLSGPPPARPQ
jgi:hypothetical protein